MKDLAFFRKEYEKQQKLEAIVNARILYRPKIKKWQVAICFATLPFLLFAAIYFPVASSLPLLLKLISSILSSIIVIEVYLRFCCILVVKCYQHYAKEETRRRCKCVPSCSEYAILSLKRVYPLLIALLKIRKRLYVTCNGEEYKIDFPTKHLQKKFEEQL